MSSQLKSAKKGQKGRSSEAKKSRPSQKVVTVDVKHPLHVFLKGHNALRNAVLEGKSKDAKASGGWNLIGVGGKSDVAPSPGDTAALAASASVGRSLVSPGLKYRFRLCDTGGLTSSSGGVINTYISWDPSTFTITDWTGISDLFGYVRTISATIHLTALNVPVGATVGGTLVAAEPSATAAVGSLNAVAACPSSKLITSYPGRTWSSSMSRPNPIFATIGAPSATADAGCYGGFLLYGAAYTASTTIWEYFIETVVECTSRD